MVPEVHNVFADTRLIYRVIRLETAVGELYDMHGDNETTVAELYDRVTHLAIALSQREITRELVDRMDHHAAITYRVVVRQTQQRYRLHKMRKYAVKCSKVIERKLRKYDAIFHDLAVRFGNLKI